MVFASVPALVVTVAVTPTAHAWVTAEVAGSDTSTLRRMRSYGKPNQTRLWYNSHARRWDALLPRDDGPLQGSDHYIVQDVPGRARFTDLEIENRDHGRPDVYWEDTTATLYVLGSHPFRSAFWRLRYDTATDAYRIEVGRSGFGVEVTGLTHPRGSLDANSPATLYVSPNGQVWASVLRDGALLVQHSTDGGQSWLATPLTLDHALRVGVTVWVSFEQGGTTYIGLFAAENGKAYTPSRFTFRYVAQTADPAIAANWVDDSSNMPRAVGAEQADDHVSAARDMAGNQYFAVKTESGMPDDPLIKLFRRTPAGQWTQYPVTATRDRPEQSRPSIVIEQNLDRLHIYTSGAEVAGPQQRTAGRFTAELDALASLSAAPFTPLFERPRTVFTDVITPRAAVDATSGMVVLAHNRNAATVWFSADGAAVSETPPVAAGGAERRRCVPLPKARTRRADAGGVRACLPLRHRSAALPPEEHG